MWMLKQVAVVVLALDLLMWAGCSGGGDSNTPPSFQGNTTVASAVIGPGGGTLTVMDPASPLNGTQLVVPAGALSSPTTITIGSPTGVTGLSADVLVVELGPTGTTFSVPVSVTIKYSLRYLTNNGISDATTLKVVSMDVGVANETLRTISQDTTQNTVTAQTTHFSNFAVVGYTNSTLSGSYGVTFYSSDAKAGPQDVINIPSVPSTVSVPFPGYAFTTSVATVTFDGAGNFTYSGTRNRGGVSSAVSGSGTYAVAANGTLTFASTGGTPHAGNVLAGGSTFILATTSGEPIEIGVGILK